MPRGLFENARSGQRRNESAATATSGKSGNVTRAGTPLLLSLDIEKDRQEITCSGSGKALLDSHENALMAYAEQEL